MEYMTKWNRSQVLNGICADVIIPSWYQSGVANPRERARRRFLEWWDANKPLTQKEIAARLKEHGFLRSQSWVSKARGGGPRLEDLDEVAWLMGTQPETLVAPDRADSAAESDVTLTLHERDLLALWKATQAVHRDHFLSLMRACAAGHVAPAAGPLTDDRPSRSSSPVVARKIQRKGTESA
jgi:hypothetical protein